MKGLWQKGSEMNRGTKQNTPQGHFVAANGIQMYYEVYGHGSPLLLLHGYTASSLHWQPYIDEFAKRFQVIVPDLRGHGYSVDPTERFTLAQAAQDVLVLLDQLEIGQFSGIGCSAGGCILQYLSTEHPSRLSSMILDSCGPYFSDQTCNVLLDWAQSDDAALEPNQHHQAEGIDQMRSLVNQLPKIIEDFNAFPPEISKITAKTIDLIPI